MGAATSFANVLPLVDEFTEVQYSHLWLGDVK